MDATLRFVTDAVNTASPLKLSTSLVQTTSTLKITTNDNPYIDAEDGAGNNRFTVGRAPASQQVNVDFASNPAGSTTAVGAIRTYRDGTNLSEAMTFIEDGSVGIGTTAPVGLLDLFKAAAATRLAIRGDAGQNRLISYRTGALQRFGLYVNNTAESGSNVGSDFAIRAYNDAGTLLSTPLFIERSTGNVGIGTTTPTRKLSVQGSTGNVISWTDAINNTGYLGIRAGAITFIAADTNLVFETAGSQHMRITATGDVGIGTTTPNNRLTVVGASGVSNGGITAYDFTGASGYGGGLTMGIENLSYQNLGKINTSLTNGGPGTIAGDMIFSTTVSATLAEKMRLTSDGYLRMASGTGGIQFNGDTAAANALDDYEEGTWTPVYYQGGVPNTATYTNQQATYTKIGNLVTAFFDLDASSITAGVGNCELYGLPFTISNTMAGFSYVPFRDPSALSTILTNAIGIGFAQRTATYVAIRQISTITGQESAVTSWFTSGRLTGVFQYTV
jgi:hypothetical protein